MDECIGCIHAHMDMDGMEDILLKCRRYPPQVLVVDGEVAQTFPDANQRCGEYSAAPEDT